MRRLLVMFIGVMACASPAAAWDSPPPECTVEQIGDLSAATPVITAPRQGRDVLLDASGTDVFVEARIDDWGLAEPALGFPPDLLLLEVRRPGGKVVATFGDAIGEGIAQGDFRAGFSERLYVVGALAVYGTDTEAACSLEAAETTFTVSRRTIGPSQVAGRIRGMMKRFMGQLDGASAGSDLILAADLLDEELDALSVLRLKTDAATRALDSWIVYVHRFTATVRGLGTALGEYRVPGPRAVATLEVRGREMARATSRLVREMRKQSR